MTEILIVDDQQDIREGIGRTIDWQRHGLHVCGTAADGNAALSMVERYEPDILIVDIHMPNMDGLELLQVVNDRYPMVKAVLISGYDDFHYAQQAVQLHAFAYLLKPLDEAELVGKVLEARTEIEAQRRRLRENTELRRQLEEGLPALRDHFIARLAAGTATGHEPDVVEHARLVGLPTGPGGYQVILFEPSRAGFDSADGAGDLILARVALQKSAAAFFHGCGQAIDFTFHDQVGVLLFDNRLPRGGILEACRHAREWANNELGTALSAGVGPVAERFEDLGETIRKAMTALDYRMVIGRNEIVEFDSVQASYRSGAAIETYRRRLAAGTTRMLWALQSGVEAEAEAEEPLKELVRGFLDAAGEDGSIRESALYLLAFQLAQLRIPLRLDFHPAGVVELFNALRSRSTAGDLEEVLRGYLAGLRRAEEERNTSHNSFVIEKAITFIRENIRRDVSLSTVARSLLIHPNYLSKLFKQAAGESFIDHVTRVKIGEAQRLLKEGTDKVYQIAEAVGYRDVEYFTRVFRKLVGVSPSQYREMA